MGKHAITRVGTPLLREAHQSRLTYKLVYSPPKIHHVTDPNVSKESLVQKFPTVKQQGSQVPHQDETIAVPSLYVSSPIPLNQAVHIATHSSISLHGLPVSSSFYHLIEPGYKIQYDTLEAPCNTFV